MKLERALDVICAETQLSRRVSVPYDCLGQSIVRDDDEQLLTIRFEYAIRTKRAPQQKCVNKRNATAAVKGDDHPPGKSINPIHELLRTCEAQKCVQTLQQKQNQSKKHQVSADPSRAVGALVTRSTWNLNTVAPLIQWLQKKGIRYVLSDWVNEFTNGERTAVVSQRGSLLSNRQLTHAKHYRCHSAFHGIHLQCTQSSISTLDDDTDWWKDAISGQDMLHNGILHSTYQKRTYVWTNHTLLHLTTNDKKTYSITVEHHHGAEKKDIAAVSLRELLTALSYHLSQHTKQQPRITYPS